MKPYSKYKPSDIQWIGNIPEHWNVNKFKRVAFYQEGPGLRNWQFTDDGIKVICVTNIVPPDIDFTKMAKYISEEEYNNSYRHFTVNKGDLLIASSGASWGKVAEYNLNETVILNTSTIRINHAIDKLLDKNLLKWIIQSKYISEQLNLLLTGSCQPNFGPTHLDQLYCVYPKDKNEQLIIANFLNYKTNQIDNAIAKKQQLIGLLEEERKAIINKAISEDNTTLQKSNVKKLKYLTTKIGSGVTPTGGSEVYQESGIPLIRSQNVYFEGLKMDDVAYISDEIHNSMANSKVLEGDVLLNITGASLGRCFYIENIDGEANVNQHVCILRPNKSILTKYLHLLLCSETGQLQIELSQNGSAREGLNFENLKNFKFIIPSINEQQEIIKYVEGQIQRINNTIFKISREIELLNEYRQSLIFEAVTGKIKVDE